MLRRIIEIDETKCNGCGACADACHEGAIAMVGGKAKLMRDDYCCLLYTSTEPSALPKCEAQAGDAAADAPSAVKGPCI